MTSVSSLGSSRLQIWMVPQLFGSSSNQQSATSVQTSPAVGILGQNVTGPTLSAIASLASVSGTAAASKAKSFQDDQKPLSFTNLVLSFNTQTNEITGLTDEMMKEISDYIEGPDLPPVAPGYPPQQKELGIVGGALQLQQVNKMTSQQLSDALYGDGLPISQNGFVNGPKPTFADYIADLKSSAAFSLQSSTNPDLPAAVQASSAVDAQRMTNDAKGMQEAYDNHTLQFIKATDVPGLNWNATYVAKGYSATKGAMETGGDENYDHAVMDQWGKDHPNSEWTSFGGVMMVWTW